MIRLTSTPRALVIGAGIGGLSAAMRLAAAGLTVTLLEAAATPGGKLRRLPGGPTGVDAGPTVFTLKAVFEQLFADCGLDLARYVQLAPLGVLARHGWPDGSQLDLFADRDASAEAVGAFAGAAAARGYRAFMQQAEAICHTLDQPFMQSPQPTPFGLVRQAGIGAMLQTRPFQTLWQALGRYFPDPRLRQLFGRYATYCGSSPFQAPATLMLIAHVEQAGLWHILGGMHCLAQGMQAAFEDLGGQIRLNARVTGIETRHGGVSGVTLASGEFLPADIVVANADREALASGLFGRDAVRAVPSMRKGGRSLSAITLTGEARLTGFPLEHHNVLFSADYPAEFTALAAGRVPESPTLYLCAQDRHGATVPDAGAPERFLMLINAPSRGDDARSGLPEGDECRRLMTETLARHGLTMDPAESPIQLTRPQEFAALFPGTGGALYGMATHGAMASFRRPTARSRLPGLYLAGGSIHPGPGLPMVALSGRMAAEAAIQDAVSTRRFLPAGMHGGIAMPSARTGNSG